MGVTMSVQVILADLALEDVLLLLNVFIAPRTQVVVNEWARPLISVKLQVAWVEIAVTIWAVLGDGFGHIALAITTLDRVVRCFCIVLDWFTSASD